MVRRRFAAGGRIGRRLLGSGRTFLTKWFCLIDLGAFDGSLMGWDGYLGCVCLQDRY